MTKDEPLSPSHGLTWDGSRKRKRWKLRLTIDRGKKLVGKRINIHLPGVSLERAIDLRNTVVEAYQLLGLRIAMRNQRGPRRIEYGKEASAPAE